MAALCLIVLFSCLMCSLAHEISSVRPIHPPLPVRRPIDETLGGSDSNFMDDVVFTITPAVLEGTVATVSVHWEGVDHPTSGDWVGLWCPGDASPYDAYPIRYQYADFGNPDPYSGSGTINFTLINLRTACRFAIVTGGAQFPFVLGQSDLFGFKEPNLPMGVHLALPDSSTGETEVRVSWISKDSETPTVKYGTTQLLLNSQAATTATYSAKDMCSSPAVDRGYLDPGLLHTAVLTGLRPNTKYFYQVGDSKTSTWGSVMSFSTAQEDAKETKFIAFGDMGQAPVDGNKQHSWDYSNQGELSSLNTSANIYKELTDASGFDPSFVLHIGDISYAVGYEYEWDNFMNQIQPIAQSIPWMTCAGNHEIGELDSFLPGTDSGGECGVAYGTRFLMPTPSTVNTPWYAFNYGLVRFVVMSTEHNFTTESEQWKFLSHELSVVDRSKTPWLVFAGHRPMYVDSSSVDHDQAVAVMLRENLEKLIYDAKVDLVLWGHHHSYQRTCPVYNEECLDDGPVHLVIGMAGYSLTKNILPTPPAYTKFVSDEFWGYTRMAATTSSFTVEVVNNANGTVMDSFTIIH